MLQSLVEQINSASRREQWLIVVNVIRKESSFWDAVEQYCGHTSEIDLVFAAPNIWGGDTETEKALKELHNNNGVEQTEVQLKNAAGNINPGTKNGKGRLASAVNFIQRGGIKLILNLSGNGL